VRNVMRKYADSMSTGRPSALSKLGVASHTGFDDDDPDTEGRDLGGQHLAHGLGRELRAAYAPDRKAGPDRTMSTWDDCTMQPESDTHRRQHAWMHSRGAQGVGVPWSAGTREGRRPRYAPDANRRCSPRMSTRPSKAITDAMPRRRRVVVRHRDQSAETKGSAPAASSRFCARRALRNGPWRIHDVPPARAERGWRSRCRLEQPGTMRSASRHADALTQGRLAATAGSRTGRRTPSACEGPTISRARSRQTSPTSRFRAEPHECGIGDHRRVTIRGASELSRPARVGRVLGLDRREPH